MSKRKLESKQPTVVLERSAKKRKVTASDDNKATETLSTEEQLGQVAENDARGDTEIGTDASTLMGKKLQKNKRRESNALELGINKPAWTLSEGRGGYLIGLDPIFSKDEECMLLAHANCVKVFSSKTSLLLRTLWTSSGGTVSGLAISKQMSSRLYVSLKLGRIELWDWEKGTRLSSWMLKSSIHSLRTCLVGEKSDQEMVFVIEHVNLSEEERASAKARWRLTVHRLHHGPQADAPGLKTLFKSHKPLKDIRVVSNGRTIVVTTDAKIIVGALNTSSAGFAELAYHWREIDSPGSVATFDAISNGPLTTSSNTEGEGAEVDVAIGCENGAIYVYRQLLRQMLNAEKKNASRPSVQRLHWHRYAVGTVKFTMGGDYLISGGLETVLVSWQLDTGKRQDLPHLGAGIEGVTVSPTGSSYAVRLASNSVITLSTLDFQATFSVSGPNWPFPASSRENGGRQARIPFFPAALQVRTGHSQLLLVTPSSGANHGGIVPRNGVYLQTVDARTGSQLTKQALTRTNVTDRISGPTGRLLDEPSVTHLQVSQDGKWLATIEQWTPATEDLDHLATAGEVSELERELREVFLKIWAYDAHSESWELNSRIDRPHGNNADASRHTKVLDLAVDTTPAAFITVGADGIVKCWRPRQRSRHGATVKDQRGQVLSTWECAHVVTPQPLDSAAITTYNLVAAKAAPSSDDSLLAVALKTKSVVSVCLIDRLSGMTMTNYDSLPARLLAGITIVGRYLVLLMEHLAVWDIVGGQMQYSVALRSSSLPTELLRATCHLATDHDNEQFAITVPTPEYGGSSSKDRARVAIFSPTNPHPVQVESLPHVALTLLHAQHSKDFHLVDSAAEVRSIAWNPVSAMYSGVDQELDGTVSEALAEVAADEDQADGRLAASALSQRSSGQPLQQTGANEHQGSNITRHALSKIFENAAPFPIMRTFEQVAALAIGKVAL